VEDAAQWLLNARLNPEGHFGYRSPQADRVAIKKVVSSGRRLIKALDELSGFARFDLEGPFALGARRRRGLPAAKNFGERGEPLRMFRAELGDLVDVAPYFAKARGPKVQPNVDINRNIAWGSATSWWESATGKQARAYEKPPSARMRTPADGAIVRFLQAFTEAIPGEKRPTGDQIRSFLRAYWSKGKREGWQMVQW
jgi:hypothetical protein